MIFNSVQFMIFFPIVIALYWVLPQKIKMVWLLAASYYFYMNWNARYALLMLFSTVATYASGLMMARIERKTAAEKQLFWKKTTVALCFTINLGILFIFKYLGLFTATAGRLLSAAGIAAELPVLDLLLPVGISFYTFQALGYTVDVYRGTVRAERNFLRYALFVSFFPQLVAGPIERSDNLLRQVKRPKPFCYENMKQGLLRMGWGLFEKMVIADRLAQLIDTVYGSYETQSGAALALATVLFAFQLYCDFAGYSDIAIGAAKVIGIDLMKNFDSPYFSETIAEFWRRWHISLSSWFKDYLYFPLGGSRGSALKTYRNTMIVFLVSGLWHGADWSFVVWGGLHGIYQVIGRMATSRHGRIPEKRSPIIRLLRVLRTFLLVDFSYIFFRASNVGMGIEIIKKMAWEFNPSSLCGGAIFELGLSKPDFIVGIIALAVLCLVSLIRRKYQIYDLIQRQNIVVRWTIYYALIFSILIFGIYGPSYSASQFIYFQF